MNLTVSSLKSVVVDHDQEASVDSAKRVTLSWALWIPLIWLFLVSTRSVSGWMGAGPRSQAITGDISAGTFEDQVVLFALILLGIAVLLTRWRYLSHVLKDNKWIVVLFGYMVLSIAWSNFPDVSWRRWIRSVGTLIMVLVVLTDASPLESFMALLRRCYYIHLPLSILAIKYFRSFGVAYNYVGSEEMWVGLTTHKNNLGQVAMSSGVVFLWSMLSKKVTWSIVGDALYLLMALGLLIGSKTSYSSTSRVGFCLGVALLLGLQYFKKNPDLLWRYAIIGLLLLGGMVGVIEMSEQWQNQTGLMSLTLEATGRDATLTGRTGLWADILENASKQPLLGVGFGAFWVGPIGYDLYPLSNWSKVTPGWRPNQGHNGFLDVYVELGLVGLCLTMGVIFAAFRNILYTLSTNFEYARIRAVFLILILFTNVTESSLLKGTHSLWLLFLLFAVNVPSIAHSKLPAKVMFHR